MPNIAIRMTNRFFSSNIFSVKMRWILTDPTAYWTRNIIQGLIFQEFVCINKGLLFSDVTVNDVILASLDHKCTVYKSFNSVNIDKFFPCYYLLFKILWYWLGSYWSGWRLLFISVRVEHIVTNDIIFCSHCWQSSNKLSK